MNDKPKIEMVALKQLCAELKVDPREARERLRLAARDAKKNPELAKSHKPGHTWEWPKSSIALKDTRGIERLALRGVVGLIPDRLKVSMRTRELESRIRAMGSNPTLSARNG